MTCGDPAQSEEAQVLFLFSIRQAPQNDFSGTPEMVKRNLRSSPGENKVPLTS
jgi:hypothetical protein